MVDKKMRRLPVINEDNRMVSLFSMGDVSRAASHEMAGELATAGWRITREPPQRSNSRTGRH